MHSPFAKSGSATQSFSVVINAEDLNLLEEIGIVKQLLQPLSYTLSMSYAVIFVDEDLQNMHIDVLSQQMFSHNRMGVRSPSCGPFVQGLFRRAAINSHFTTLMKDLPPTLKSDLAAFQGIVDRYSEENSSLLNDRNPVVLRSVAPGMELPQYAVKLPKSQPELVWLEAMPDYLRPIAQALSVIPELARLKQASSLLSGTRALVETPSTAISDFCVQTVTDSNAGIEATPLIHSRDPSSKPKEKPTAVLPSNPAPSEASSSGVDVDEHPIASPPLAEDSGSAMDVDEHPLPSLRFPRGRGRGILRPTSTPTPQTSDLQRFTSTLPLVPPRFTPTRPLVNLYSGEYSHAPYAILQHISALPHTVQSPKEDTELAHKDLRVEAIKVQDIVLDLNPAKSVQGQELVPADMNDLERKAVESSRITTRKKQKKTPLETGNM
ncbi:hypothetical protein B0H19DRAFT_1066547 [Mycena capillaripes]|nr:hypothetical protein B0H19DRAFT_1066547 [Mycena capillaripes]